MRLNSKASKIDWFNTLVWSSILIISVSIWTFVISLFL
jgi:hypothetical protein